MKRCGGVFERVHARQTLTQALWRAARGKRDRPEVRACLADADAILDGLQQRLRDGCYRFAAYRRFEVRDTKRRTIHAPPFVDRVVHHAIIAAAGSSLERGAIAHSYACRTGRGQHAAIAQARTYMQRADWYGKMDVRRFYDSVDHAVLRRLLWRRFRESRLLELFDDLLASYQTLPGRGLPIGALTSQYLGNFYLDVFDQALQHSGHASRYLRYMDDALVFGTREQIDAVRTRAISALATLGLELKHGGEWNRVTCGVPWLGFVLYPDRQRLNRVGRRRFRRKLRALRRQHAAGRLGESGAQVRATALGAHPSVADDVGWRRAVLRLHDFGEPRGAWHGATPEGDTPRPRPRGPRWLLVRPCRALPRRLPRLAQARDSLPGPGLSGRLVSRHDNGERRPPSTDGACSRAGSPGDPDETSRKPPPGPDIQAEDDAENGPGGAAPDGRIDTPC